MICPRCKKDFDDDSQGSKIKCSHCKALVRWSMVHDGKVYYIPSHMIEGINRYVLDRCPTGDFLTAVFRGDWVEALGRADRQNFANIQAYGDLLYNHVPVAAWGSKKKVKDWLNRNWYVCQCGQEKEITLSQYVINTKCSACQRTGKWTKK